MPPLKDSGERRQVETGAVRDRAKGKGRMDLLPVDAIFELAAHFEDGALKYTDRNWEKGMPLSWYLDSMLRHAFKRLRGDVDERHDRAMAWNAMCFIQTKAWIDQGVLPQSLNDLPTYVRSFGECICPPNCHDEGCPFSSIKAEPGVSADDAAALDAYQVAAKTVYGENLENPFIDEDDLANPKHARTPIQRTTRPSHVHRFRQHPDHITNPGLDYVLFVNNEGQFVYKDGSRWTNDYPIEAYGESPEWTLDEE